MFMSFSSWLRRYMTGVAARERSVIQVVLLYSRGPPLSRPSNITKTSMTFVWR